MLNVKIHGVAQETRPVACSLDLEGLVVVVKQHMPWDGLSRGRTKHWRIRERETC
jgi:hypothetical protein